MKELGDFWGIQFTRARTVFSGCHERPLWSKIAVFAFFLLIIIKQLTHLMNSYCWSMWLMDGEQEIACCRNRLSLSVELTAELEKYQRAWAAAEMTKIEWHSLCIHLSFSMQGQYQQSSKKEASMDVSEERMPCLLAHWWMAYVQTPRLIHKLHLSCPFFLWGRRTNLEPLCCLD